MKQHLTAVILFPGLLALTACGSSPKGESSKYDEANYVSLRTTNKVTKKSCPKNEKSFSRQNKRQLMELGNACAQAKAWRMLEKIGGRLAKLDPKSPWGAYFLSLGSQGQGNHTRALWMADLALKKSPRLGFLHYQKGRVLWTMGEYDSAVGTMREALKYDKSLTDAHLFLGQVYYRDRDVSKAARHFKSVLNSEPNNLSALIGVAESNYQAKNNRAAITYFEKAVDNSPQNLNLRNRLAEVYEKEEQYGEALAVYRKTKRILSRRSKSNQSQILAVSEKIEALEEMVAAQAPGRKVTRSEASERRSK